MNNQDPPTTCPSEETRQKIKAMADIFATIPAEERFAITLLFGLLSMDLFPGVSIFSAWAPPPIPGQDPGTPAAGEKTP